MITWQKYKTAFLSFILLSLVFLFAVHLRVEDYSAWRKQPSVFKYNEEFQMANPDCYYYLQFAKDLKDKTYQAKDDKRWAPMGVMNPSIPPLLSYMTYVIHACSGFSLDKIAVFLPVFLSSLLAVIVFLYMRLFKASIWVSLVASLFSVFSLTYVYRTRIGVYDTDCLNAVFIMLNSYLFHLLAKVKGEYGKYGLLGILSTALFLWWWNTAQVVVALSVCFLIVVYVLFFSAFSTWRLKGSLVLTVIVGFVIFWYQDFLNLFYLLFGKSKSIPIVGGVSELTPVTLHEFIQKTIDQPFVFICMLLGLIYGFYRYKQWMLFLIIPVVLAFIAFFAGNRFLLFSAPILAMGLGFLLQWMEGLSRNARYVSFAFAFFIIILSLPKNYQTITHKYANLSALNYIPILNSIKNNTPNQAAILTDWDLGYLIRYYTQRASYADGEITGKGDILYYTSMPLAQPSLAFAARFIHFYTQNQSGFQWWMKQFSSQKQAIEELQQILLIDSSRVSSFMLKNSSQKQSFYQQKPPLGTNWADFFYPEVKQEVYLLLHQQMLQTVFWFKQGNLDLNTMQTKGLPLYLQEYNMQEVSGIIQGPQLKVNTQNGQCLFMGNTQQQFSEVLTQALDTFYIKQYISQNPQSFVFHWYQPLGFGAAMSKEMSQSVFHQLFMLHKKSPHFTPIDLQSPLYQLYRVEPF